MATAQLAQLQGTATPPPKRPTDFPGLLKAFQSEIARALPRHLNPDRMARIALTEFRKNPRLGQCNPRSVFAAVVQASQMGLEPGLMGQAYLVPYKEECQLIPGYQGLIELVRRSGKVRRIEAHVVYERDRFVYRTGLHTVLEHEPVLDGERGEMRLAYAVAEFDASGDAYHVEVMSRRQIEAIRDRSQNVQRAKKYDKTTPWDTDPEEMWRKTVLRRICKFLPKSAELVAAIALEEAAATGSQRLTIEEAIEGTWAPVPAEGEPEADAGRIATLPTPEAIAAEPWPHQDPDGTWRDASGAAYDPAQHGWSAQENRPSVTDRGLFRSRRGSTPRPGPRRAEPERPPQDGPGAGPGAADDWSIE